MKNKREKDKEIKHEKDTEDKHKKHIENLEEAPIGYLMGEISRLNHSRMHTLLAEIGLFRGQPPILHILGEDDGVTQKEIAEKLNLAPATITDTLQRMERAGLLERRTDKEDQRVSRVFITEKGRSTRQEVGNAFKMLEDDLIKGFTLEEKVLLRRFFIQMRKNLIEVSNE